MALVGLKLSGDDMPVRFPRQFGDILLHATNSTQSISIRLRPPYSKFKLRHDPDPDTGCTIGALPSHLSAYRSEPLRWLALRYAKCCREIFAASSCVRAGQSFGTDCRRLHRGPN